VTLKKVTLAAGSYMVTLGKSSGEAKDASALTSQGVPLTVKPAGVGKSDPRSFKGPIEGFLLRSPLVRGWQGLEMKAAGPEGPLTPLRIDRLSPDVILCIFSGQLESIEVRQPPEGMHFGATLNAGKYEKKILRSVIKMSDGKKPGAQLHLVVKDPKTQKMGSPIYVPVSEKRVVKVNELAKELHERLKDEHGMDPKKEFTSAEFGVQMTESPGQFLINVKKGGQ
jgi:hypothetical protein